MTNIAASIFTLTPGADVVRGTPAGDTLEAAPGTLGAGDDIDLGDGVDTMVLTAGGTYDLTAPLNFAGVDAIQGSNGNDVLVISQARLAGIGLIDLGIGLNTVQVSRPGKTDFSAVEIHNARIRGTQAEDFIVGTSGDDVIIPAGGAADTVDGGAGRDTVLTDAFFSQFHAIPPDPAANVLANSRAYDVAGSRVVVLNVERIELRDGIVLLDQGASGVEAYRLIHAAGGTLPLESNLLDTTARLNAGSSTTEVMGRLMQSLDFERAFGDVRSDAAFVDALYRVVLGRQADEGGRAVQLDALAHGTARASLLVAFADSAEHVGVIGRAATLDGLFVAEVGIA